MERSAHAKPLYPYREILEVKTTAFKYGSTYDVSVYDSSGAFELLTDALVKTELYYLEEPTDDAKDNHREADNERLNEQELAESARLFTEELDAIAGMSQGDVWGFDDIYLLQDERNNGRTAGFKSQAGAAQMGENPVYQIDPKF